jgi:hypothetical protein
MRRFLSWWFIIGGLLIAGWGLYSAVQALGGLYNDTVADPLGQPDGKEQAVSRSMLTNAAYGATGIPLLIIGGWLRRMPRRR